MSAFRLQTMFPIFILLIIFMARQSLNAQSVSFCEKQLVAVDASAPIVVSDVLQAREGIIQLRGHIDIPGGTSTDVWGYFDEANQREYAIIGGSGSFGFSIVDVTDPTSAQIVAQVAGVPGFDVKVWRHFVYTVTGGSGVGLGKIIDIVDPAEPKIVGSFDSSHNIFITDDGYMILESPGIRVFNLNPDPINPTLVWAGGSEGHDASVINNVLYDFHGYAGTFIYDFLEPANPTLIGAIDDPELVYHHSGWTSVDGNYLFICDEGSRHPSPDIFVYNISDPANPERVGQFGDSLAIIHNLFVVGDYAVTSYYSAGFRVFDVSEPSNPLLIDEYDTAPYSSAGFSGAWGVYPFAPSGLIYVSDIQGGLYIFEVQGLIDSVISDNELHPGSIVLFENYPNPFNPATLISYHVRERQHIKLNIYNTLGQKIRTLVNEEKTVGRDQITWDGSNDSGTKVPTGIYFYNLKTDDFSATKRMLLLK